MVFFGYEAVFGQLRIHTRLKGLVISSFVKFLYSSFSVFKFRKNLVKLFISKPNEQFQN